MMPRLLIIAVLGLGLLAVSACQNDKDNEIPQVGFQPHGKPVPTPRPTPDGTTRLPPDANGDPAFVNATPPPQNNPQAAQPPSKPAARDVPYGIPVQGKPGYVVSPYAPESGQIDVRGFAPGQEAMDPLTNKVFLVP